MVAISVDEVETSKDLAKKLGLAFPLASDPDLRVIRAYGVADESNGIAWPAEFLVDSTGAIRWRTPAKSVDERAPAREVIEAFDALGK